MTRKNKAGAITHDDVRQAIVKFKRAGGLVKSLPEEPTPVNRLVGKKWAMYESPFENMPASVEL